MKLPKMQAKMCFFVSRPSNVGKTSMITNISQLFCIFSDPFGALRREFGLDLRLCTPSRSRHPLSHQKLVVASPRRGHPFVPADGVRPVGPNQGHAGVPPRQEPDSAVQVDHGRADRGCGGSGALRTHAPIDGNRAAIA